MKNGGRRALPAVYGIHGFFSVSGRLESIGEPLNQEREAKMAALTKENDELRHNLNGAVQREAAKQSAAMRARRDQAERAAAEVRREMRHWRLVAQELPVQADELLSLRALAAAVEAATDRGMLPRNLRLVLGEMQSVEYRRARLLAAQQARRGP
jgi:hypothetical protein